MRVGTSPRPAHQARLTSAAARAQGRLRAIPGTHGQWRDDDYTEMPGESAFGTGLPPSAVDGGARVEFDLQPGEVRLRVKSQKLYYEG